MKKDSGRYVSPKIVVVKLAHSAPVCLTTSAIGSNGPAIDDYEINGTTIIWN